MCTSKWHRASQNGLLTKPEGPIRGPFQCSYHQEHIIFGSMLALPISRNSNIHRVLIEAYTKGCERDRGSYFTFYMTMCFEKVALHPGQLHLAFSEP